MFKQFLVGSNDSMRRTRQRESFLEGEPEIGITVTRRITTMWRTPSRAAVLVPGKTKAM
jgi:hypothetical protein